LNLADAALLLLLLAVVNQSTRRFNYWR